MEDIDRSKTAVSFVETLRFGVDSRPEDPVD